MAIPLGRRLPDASRGLPGRRLENALGRPLLAYPMPPLFGLAPGGVCRAVLVAENAVRSYRTVSPLPVTRDLSREPAVSFLWHCPWGRPRLALPGTVFPWSPDFPPPSLR